MPKVLTDQVKRFRSGSPPDLAVRESARESIRPEWLVTQCSLPAENNYYLSYERGYDDWEQVAAFPEYTSFRLLLLRVTTSLSYSSAPRREDSSPGAQVQENSTTMDYELFRVSRRYRFYTADRPHYADSGVESIFSWTYRAGSNDLVRTRAHQRVADSGRSV